MSASFRRCAARSVFALLAAGLLPLAGRAQEHAAHAAPMVMPNEPALGASAAFAPDGALWVASVRGQHVVLQRSADLGRTLGAPVAVNAVPEEIYASSENRPKLAFGPHGEIDVQWTDRPAAGWVGNVRFARSTDGGRTFSAPLTVNHDTAPATRGFDALAVAGNGDIVSAWIDGRDHAAAKAAGRPYPGFAFYFARSSDGGRSFTPERKLVDHSCECCRTTLARLPNGDVAAFFRAIYGNDIRDHAFAVLPAGTAPTRVERATFDQWQVAACPDHGPGLAIGSDGTPHAVWFEAKGRPTIWYGQLDPGHPPRHTLILATAGASHADVAVHGHTVWVTWNQVSADGYALMLRRSDDGGVHFGAAQAIARSAQAAGSPQLLVRDGRAFVAWNTERAFRLIPTGSTP